jgi:hypothetical protein
VAVVLGAHRTTSDAGGGRGTVQRLGSDVNTL